MRHLDRGYASHIGTVGGALFDTMDLPDGSWSTAHRSDCAILAYISCPPTVVQSSIACGQLSLDLA